jgi:hypothetical protein
MAEGSEAVVNQGTRTRPSSPPEPGDICPACERRVPIPREDATPRRRQQWNVSVPADAENGKEVLTTLTAACRERLQDVLGHDIDTPPYYTLVAVMHDWLGEH